MSKFKELSITELYKTSGENFFGGSNGYSWRDKKGHWHYTVTSGVSSTVAQIIGNGWGSAGAPGVGQR